MIHPDTELRFIDKEVGHGVVATRFIPAGTITWVLDPLDREFTPEQLQKMPALFQRDLKIYSYRNNIGNYVLCWDHGRYVNHSFRSNCMSTAYDFEIAIRDIHPGEQLTDDYGYLNVEEPFHPVDEGTDRKIVYPDDLKNYSDSWDQKIAEIFPKILKHEQPLFQVMSVTMQDKIKNIIEQQAPITSIESVYYDPSNKA
ncbi:MAG: SET domain-containing protein [Flavobacteriaceae bacterium]|nr:SET domain-containing protein [Flavobacteriaceae bacterium]